VLVVVPFLTDADTTSTTTSGEPSTLLPAGAETATVVSITDGDTLRLQLADGTLESVRLIGINTPEASECWADEAVLALADLTPVRSQVRITADTSNRDQFDRLLRYLWVGDMSINVEMVRRGAAVSRRYPPDTAMTDRLEQAQSEAREARRGLWAPDACGAGADAELIITELGYDPPGDDNRDLNEEYIRIRNEGDSATDMSGWTIKDESSSNRYTFPAGFSIAPGETVTIHSGCGDDFDTRLFWCSVDSAVWNNDGDTAFLIDAAGNTHTTHTYEP
jgi:micrococcal nuclease